MPRREPTAGAFFCKQVALIANGLEDTFIWWALAGRSRLAPNASPTLAFGRWCHWNGPSEADCRGRIHLLCCRLRHKLPGGLRSWNSVAAFTAIRDAITFPAST